MASETETADCEACVAQMGADGLTVCGGVRRAPGCTGRPVAETLLRPDEWPEDLRVREFPTRREET